MNKICTSIEQSKKLIELGIDIDTADMFWKNGVSDKYIQCFTPFCIHRSRMDFLLRNLNFMPGLFFHHLGASLQLSTPSKGSGFPGLRFTPFLRNGPAAPTIPCADQISILPQNRSSNFTKST